MVKGLTVWLPLAVAVLSAVLGFGLRATWEEVRDFRAARRVVVSELLACSRALRSADHPAAGPSDIISVSGYRTVSLVLARYLPDHLWRDLEDLYGLFASVNDEPERLAQAGNVLRDRLLRKIEQTRPALDACRLRHALHVGSPGRRAAE